MEWAVHEACREARMMHARFWYAKVKERDYLQGLAKIWG
jgi:hypothetical protein